MLSARKFLGLKRWALLNRTAINSFSTIIWHGRNNIWAFLISGGWKEIFPSRLLIGFRGAVCNVINYAKLIWKRYEVWSFTSVPTFSTLRFQKEGRGFFFFLNIPWWFLVPSVIHSTQDAPKLLVSGLRVDSAKCICFQIAFKINQTKHCSNNFSRHSYIPEKGKYNIYKA